MSETELQALLQAADLAAMIRDPLELAEVAGRVEALLAAHPDLDGDAARSRLQALASQIAETPTEPELEPSAGEDYTRGVSAYTEGKFDEALSHWSAAAQTAPDNFELRRRIALVQRALGQHEAADASIEHLLEMYRESDDPRLTVLTEVAVDRFKVGGRLVVAYRMLRPRRPELAYVWTFVTPGDDPMSRMSVQVETSPYAQQRGVPYMLAMNTPEGHQTLGQAFATLPPYEKLRQAAAHWIAKVLDLGEH